MRQRYMLDCDVCGEPVYLTPQRYVELKRQDRRPRCRKNGCERLCGVQTPATARTPELIDVIEVPPRVVYWPRRKKGNANGALAKLHVTLDQDWRSESAGEANERTNM
jgi:hypothetical protein